MEQRTFRIVETIFKNTPMWSAQELVNGEWKHVPNTTVHEGKDFCKQVLFGIINHKEKVVEQFTI